MEDLIEFTQPAQEYLADLLSKQEIKNVAVRVFITQAGTARAETCLAYCKPGEEEATDISMSLEKFQVFLDQPSIAFLSDAVVDYNKDKFGGQLTIRAPNAKLPKIDANSSLFDRINYILYSEINPNLASHGGMVQLLELTSDNVAVLQFGGGCQGCAIVDSTLKDGVERTLIERLPEVQGVRDVTDHSQTEGAYFK